MSSTRVTDLDVGVTSAAELAGQLLVVGFSGRTVPEALALGLSRKELAGVVLFRRNLAPDVAGLIELQALCRAIGNAAAAGFPPLIAIDEEGGRVARLSPPALVLPPMRCIADLGDLALMERVARTLGRQLASLGITMNFAPVVDVDTNPENPIIGDRSLSRLPEPVVRMAGAYMRGLRSGGVQNCLKHYPGHGDTALDSHLALPTVEHTRERLEAVELLPFRRLAGEADSIMTAHVVYPHLDADRPATLSPFIATELLRNQFGFQGVLFSDDLEMQAISEAHGAADAAGAASIEGAACAALRAGCDVLLVCSRADIQARVHEALVREIERDPSFRARCLVAARRSLALRRARPPAPTSAADLKRLLEAEVAALQTELAQCLDSAT